MKPTERTRLARLRLRSQRIESAVGHNAEPISAAEVVRWMTAMQAQDLPGALWAVALRMPLGTRDRVVDAFEQGDVVRSWPFRGTLHLVAGEDLGWMLDLTAARTIAGAASRHRGLGLDPETFDRARGIAEEALAGGRARTRDQLFQAFQAGGVSTEGQRGVHLLWYLAHTQTICFGPIDGTNQSLVLLDEWIGHPRRLERDESLGELALRYFCSHGPATVKDFLWWSKVLVKEAAIGLELARPHLESITVDGVDYWMAAGASDGDGPAGVSLLPGFDEYILGYTDRTAMLDEGAFERIVPGGNGMFLPTIVVDGNVSGTWKRKATTRQVEITPEPFAPMSATVSRRIDRGSADYARFLGLPLAGAKRTAGTKKAAGPTRE